ncbi:hypothetical protein Ddc_18941 [Ditylenchus destructor]|nr:hypothetical protein Ddc_18941 [Ditylenchus destructor]
MSRIFGNAILDTPFSRSEKCPEFLERPFLIHRFKSHPRAKRAGGAREAREWGARSARVGRAKRASGAREAREWGAKRAGGAREARGWGARVARAKRAAGASPVSNTPGV